MQYFVCRVSIAPLRAAPSEKSEMVSQLLFGEGGAAHERRDNWYLATSAWDGQSGWIDQKQVVIIDQADYAAYQERYAVSLSLVEGLMADDHFVPLTLGATLPRFDGLRCDLGGKNFQFSGAAVHPGPDRHSGVWIAKIAKKYLHAPYLWGGRSPFGIDGAGLTQMAYKAAGIKLMRRPEQQVLQGRPVDFTEQCQEGDLAFFDSGKGDIGHVGIVLEGCQIIHAYGSVRVDKLDHFGIYCPESNRYTHQLRVIRRLLPDSLPTNDVANAANNGSLSSAPAPSQTALFE